MASNENQNQIICTNFKEGYEKILLNETGILICYS